MRECLLAPARLSSMHVMWMRHGHPLRGLCRRLLVKICEEKRAHHPPKPLPPGETADEVHLNQAELGRLVQEAALSLGAPADGDQHPSRVLWQDQGSELIVNLSGVTARALPGVMLLEVPVHCDQVGDSVIRMAFAVGNDQRPAGMVSTTEARPRGPAAVVDVWGDALVAFGWHLVLKVAEAVAAEVGIDEEGDELVSAALTASGVGLSVLPMARHVFTRKLDPVVEQPLVLTRPAPYPPHPPRQVRGRP